MNGHDDGNGSVDDNDDEGLGLVDSSDETADSLSYMVLA